MTVETAHRYHEATASVGFGSGRRFVKHVDLSKRKKIMDAIWGLAETMSNSTGVSHTRSDCVSYFEQAGFTDVEVHEFIPGILVRVCGSKRGKAG